MHWSHQGNTHAKLVQENEGSGPSSLCCTADPALSTVVPCTANARTCKHKREDWPLESSFLLFDLSKPFILPLLPLALRLIFLTSPCNLDLVTIHKASEGKCKLWRGCFPLLNNLQHYPSLFLSLWFLMLIFSSKLSPGGQWFLDWDGKICLSQKPDTFGEHILMLFTDHKFVAEWVTLLIVSHHYHLVEKTANIQQISYIDLHFLCFPQDTTFRSF